MATNSRDDIASSAQEHFEFDCEHLIKFILKFNSRTADADSSAVLEAKLKDLESRWGRLDSSYEAIMVSRSPLITTEYREQATERYEECTEEFYQCTGKIVELIKCLQLENSNFTRFQSTPNLPVSQNRDQTFTNVNSSQLIKLPPCDTEVFEGSYEQWPSFRDMFTALYIKHSALTPVTKLYHLRKKTTGEAGAIVKRYFLSNENFDLAWNALRTRYENKRVLVDNQIKTLFNIPSTTREDSEAIRKIQSAVDDSLAMLKTLDIDVESWDPILIRLISTKLPETTLALWEQSLKSPRELPKWSQMSQFLVDRYESVERLTNIKSSKTNFNITKSNSSTIQTYASQENLNECRICSENHSLRVCPKFRAFTVQQRVDFVFKNKICNNCLASSHLKANCKSKHSCLICKKSHHTLLHMKQNPQSSAFTQETSKYKDNVGNYEKTHKSPSQNLFHKTKVDTLDAMPSCSTKVQSNCSSSNENILLRTAIVKIESRGEIFNVRALIDPGSQRTFLTEKIRSRLQLPYKKNHFEIIGIGGQKQSSNKECEFILYAEKFNLRVPVKAIVLSKVTKRLPASTFKIPDSHDLLELDLADPTFNQSGQIDLILGNDYEHALNVDGIRKNICGQASAYKTIFGWVLSGPMDTQTIQTFTTSVNPSNTMELNNLLRQFWEQEEIPVTRTKSEDEEFCEKFYSQTTTRNENGRYIVRLPFKREFPDQVYLGSSRFIALAQFSNMDKKLAKDSMLQEQYKEVLKEYVTLDHMEETSSCESFCQNKYSSFYLPHHAVFRPEHKTTKVRVVFNASRKTKSGFSLNDVLHTGPTLQNDLMLIILNWRKYKYVFSGDIQKMYRQIEIHPDDRAFQRILFQPEKDGPIKDYQLKTVTFGVNCAPYLAIRTLFQLASDYQSDYPKASAILRSETYVDDILSGGYSIHETVEAQSQVISVLKLAGLPLKKITANDPQLISHLPKEDLYDIDFLRFHDTSATKTLGIKWNALSDSFTYKFTPLDQSENITKRQILSAVAKLFDPAGWLAPIIIRAKIIMQQLWLEGLEWDQQISTDTLQTWNNFVKDLSNTETICIPRWLQYLPTDIIQIHGFADASKSAYCAAVYIRCTNDKNNTFTNLLTAKSKVAPIQTVSLPRLELNGAVLLANLVNYVISALKFKTEEIHLWTDSSIVLGWLSKPPSNWETYVANRVSKIHSLLPNAKWKHVPTHDNPADSGTRGVRPQDLLYNSTWWHGPSWLSKPSSEWPQRNPLKISESTQVKVHSLHSEVHEDILNRFSSYSRALRVLSYVLRFLNNCGKKLSTRIDFSNKMELTQTEVKRTKIRLIILAQKTFYSEEYQCLSNSQIISNKSCLKSLNPFLDDHGVLRVNGRLSRSSLPYDERYPIILPGGSRLCQLYLTYLHEFLQHAECSQMCRMTQTEFYVFRLKPRLKKIIRSCKTCTIYRQQPGSQIMAPLPPERCNLSLPFQTTGIDFAGPFELKTSSLRKSPFVKGYVSVFVCFSTKAIHLEPCSDLSSSAFLAAFARFVGRRGLPQRVVTDNGRNFLGASRILELEFTNFVERVAQDTATKYLTNGFEWKFIPPHAPHMGGLWEAAVKSFKFHLKRVAGSQKFTFEEFATILARIEGVLNSRPISALSEDPADLTALTPGHFLRGAPLLALPEQNSEKMSLINRWEKLKVIHHQFAIQWKHEYLKTLHKRYKWKNSVPNLQVNDLVVVMDDLQPPHEWRLGRIHKTYAGADNNIRIADIRISTGLITRPIVKLCYLPLLKNDNDS